MQTNQPIQRQQIPPPSPPPESEYRFRWSIWLGVPGVVLMFFWLINGLEESFSFEDLMDGLNVMYQYKCARLACLAVILIAATLITKTLKHHSDKH
ncbi:hypothetical protein ACFL6U_23355 [Planctomycetota bacterium]